MRPWSGERDAAQSPIQPPKKFPMAAQALKTAKTVAAVESDQPWSWKKRTVKAMPDQGVEPKMPCGGRTRGGRLLGGRAVIQT